VPGPNWFSHPLGGVLCPACGPREPTASAVPLNVLKALRYLQRTPTLAASRVQVTAEVAGGVEALHAELAASDPRAAERLNLRDRTRIARALEVVEATGRSLLDWHHEGQPPLLPGDSFRAVFLAPERDELYARIDARFEAMLGAGALEEVERLADRNLDPLLPAMKAHGVPALIRHLRGELSLEQAATIGRADTRHYAKRQFTWFRHQLPEFEWVKPEEMRNWLATIVNAARDPG